MKILLSYYHVFLNFSILDSLVLQDKIKWEFYNYFYSSFSTYTYLLANSKPFTELSVGKTPCGPDETLCPGGCCTLADAYCCPDLKHCAPSPDKCPQSKSESVKKKLLSVGKYNCNGTDEIQCPGGCCHGGPNWPNWPNWHCCRYGAFCAPYAEDCIIASHLPFSQAGG